MLEDRDWKKEQPSIGNVLGGLLVLAIIAALTVAAVYLVIHA